MTWTDITAPISDDVHPYIAGVPYAKTRPIFTLERDGVESHEILMSTLSGTYFETGRHVRSDAISVDQVPIETFVGPAAVVDVGHKRPAEPIAESDLTPHQDIIHPGDAVIVRTHWSSRWNTPDYFLKSPYFTTEALEWLLAREIRILAADIPSYDNPNSSQGLIKRMFQDDSTFLLAPLVNLHAVTRVRVTLYAFPLKLVGVSGSPARVLVLED